MRILDCFRYYLEGVPELLEHRRLHCISVRKKIFKLKFFVSRLILDFETPIF